MTAKASPHVRFRRAIDARSIPLAELTAREMRHLTLAEALELLVLYAEKCDSKIERAACRWLSRLTDECEHLTLAEAQLAASALASLPTTTQAATTLRHLIS